MNQTFDVGLLEGNYVHMKREVGEDGTVTDTPLFHMKDGMIKNNPFSKSIKSSLSAMWMLNNRNRALHKIREVMRSERLGTHEADECFEFALYFFLEREDRDFKSKYFGEDAVNSYSIDIYCLSKLRYIVWHYRNEMRARLANTVYLIDRDKDDMEAMPKKSISFDLLNKASFEEEKKSYGFNEVVEFDELQELLDVVVPYYNDEFKMFGLVNFDFKKYVYYTFLSNKELVLEKKHLSDETLDEIAEELGMSVNALTIINKRVSDLLKTRPDVFGDLRDVLFRLVEGKINGWKPVYNA